MEELSKPLEIQIWQSIEHIDRYQEVDESIIGSFFIDLNEITKVSNPWLKSQAQGVLYSHDAYYTMLDKTNDCITPDRLGVKILMSKRDSANHSDTLQDLLHLSMNKLTGVIQRDHDQSLKGSIELDDLHQVIEEEIKTQM